MAASAAALAVASDTPRMALAPRRDLLRVPSSWTIAASWKTGSGQPIATYSVVAIQDSTTLQTWTITGDSFSETMPAFTTTSPVTLAVTPQGNYGSGPESAAATFLAVAPGSVSAVSDGATVTVSWSAPTDAPDGASPPSPADTT